MTTASGRRALSDEEYLARAHRPRRRFTVPVLAAVVVALGVALAVFLAVRSSRSLSASVTAYHIGDHGVRVTVQLTRPDPDREVACVVRALGRDRSELGSTRVTVRAGGRSPEFSRTIRTSNRPVAADVESCQYR